MLGWLALTMNGQIAIEEAPHGAIHGDWHLFPQRYRHGQVPRTRNGPSLFASQLWKTFSASPSPSSSKWPDQKKNPPTNQCWIAQQFGTAWKVTPRVTALLALPLQPALTWAETQRKLDPKWVSVLQNKNSILFVGMDVCLPLSWQLWLEFSRLIGSLFWLPFDCFETEVQCSLMGPVPLYFSHVSDFTGSSIQRQISSLLIGSKSCPALPFMGGLVQGICLELPALPMGSIKPNSGFRHCKQTLRGSSPMD